MPESRKIGEGCLFLTFPQTQPSYVRLSQGPVWRLYRKVKFANNWNLLRQMSKGQKNVARISSIDTPGMPYSRSMSARRIENRRSAA